VADGAFLSRGGHVAKTGLRRGVFAEKQDDGEDGEAAHGSTILDQEVCRGASQRGSFQASEIWEAARFLDDALLAERKAIQRLTAARG
jgi:hypothetical protein